MQTADQTWNETDIIELRKAMRQIYQEPATKQDSSWHKLLSFKSVGGAMKNNIENLLRESNV